MMKIGFFIITLIGISSVHGADTTVPNCEPSRFTKPLPPTCACYESINQLVCTDVAPGTYLQLAKETIFDKVFLQNVNNFSAFFENLNKGASLTTNTLVVDVTTGDNISGLNLENLIRFAAKRLQIKGPFQSNNDAAKRLQLDLGNLDSHWETLEWISLENLKITGFDVENLQKLKSLSHLELNGVTILNSVPDKFSLRLDTLTRLRMNNVQGISKFVGVTFTRCSANERRYIELRNNADLKQFDFSNLNLKDATCLYHIDLSGSGLNPDNLVKAEQSLVDIANKEQLYLIMQDVSQTCNKCLHELATKTNAGYINSVKCDTSIPDIQGQYLAEIPPSGALYDKLGTAPCPKKTPR